MPNEATAPARDDSDPDPLIEEMLGFAGPPTPDTPVLLGEYTRAEAEDRGAFHDEALAGSPEFRGLDRPYRRSGEG